MNELYNIISIFVTSGLILVCGLMFLFVNFPRTPLLNNYRKARKMMATAYLFFVGMNIAEYMSDAFYESDVLFLRTVTLAVAVSQALLFTLALLSLLEVRFPGWRYIFMKSIPAVVLCTTIFIVHAFCSDRCFTIAFYGLAGMYFLLLIYYTRLFLARYRLFHRQMDNYFSDNEVERMRWVAFLFFAALTIGVMALVSVIFHDIFVALLFTLALDVFYVWFAFRFVNYTYWFHTIEPALNNELKETPVLPEVEKTVVANPATETFPSAVFATLEEQIEQWVAGRKFVDKGITIDKLSLEFYTNRNYLSTYINTYKGKTFREWINELRIEEAKILMRQYPDMIVNEVAIQVGFTDKSHFIRNFTKQTGKSPKKWKEILP